MRSSIKSRSTSHNLSEESRSLSISSASADSSPFTICGRHASEHLLDCRDVRLDFDLRPRLRPDRPAPISSLRNPFLFGNSNHGVRTGVIVQPLALTFFYAN
jgi:hypothetical protein